MSRERSNSDDVWMPSGLASAISKLENVIDASDSEGRRFAHLHRDFLEDILYDLRTTAAVYEK